MDDKKFALLGRGGSRVVAARARILGERLPAGTDFQRHWSRKASLLEAAKAVHAEAIYATVFRFTSSKTHATDFAN